MARRDPSLEIDRFEFERTLLRCGASRIAGVDEAGRGPLAGPVVAAAVVFPETWISGSLPDQLKGLNDSKQLTSEERDVFHEFLIHCPELCFAVAQIDAPTIDRINILEATRRAMIEALGQLGSAPDHVLVDGLPVPTLPHPQTAIVKGDSRSYSIAAASVLAKVTRDSLMRNYDLEFPAYGFGDHKGYGTPGHLAALAEHGPCPIHRRTFAPLKPTQGELFEGS